MRFGFDKYTGENLFPTIGDRRRDETVDTFLFTIEDLNGAVIDDCRIKIDYSVDKFHVTIEEVVLSKTIVLDKLSSETIKEQIKYIIILLEEDYLKRNDYELVIDHKWLGELPF